MKVAPNQTEVKTKLAEVYEITGQLQKALDLIDQGSRLRFNIYSVVLILSSVIESREEHKTKATTSTDTPAEDMTPSGAPLDPAIGSFFDENSRKTVSKGLKQRKVPGMTREQLVEYEKNREQATIATFARLDASEESMLQGERRAVLMWLADAGTLVEEFRVTRQLFTSDRVREQSILCFYCASSIFNFHSQECDIPWCDRPKTSQARSASQTRRFRGARI
jgi:general transcription factor 3C polypeptide 3 (transcription factor C subunit 4)